jgi:hypothetical protein
MGELIWSTVGMILTSEYQVHGENPIPVPLCPPQIQHRLAWNRNQVSTVKDESSSFIPQFALQKIHSLFESEFSTEYDTVWQLTSSFSSSRHFNPFLYLSFNNVI